MLLCILGLLAILILFPTKFTYYENLDGVYLVSYIYED